MPITLSWSSWRSELSEPVPHTFCDDCLKLLTAPESLATVGLKFSYAALEKSIADGCRLCYLFYQAWFKKLFVDPKVGASPRTNIEHVVFQCNLRPDPENYRLSPLHYGVGLNFALVEGEAPKIAARVIPEYANLGLAQQWIEHCVKTHPGCARSFNGELPKRIIDVGDESGILRPRLVTSLDNGNDNYVALSRCWGDRQPVVTTTSNYENHLRGIEWISLPKSFQDAIEVTRSLGYRYLWIDSLCILQDDAEHWREQCPRMVSIYSNATVTIAAAGAENAFEGFLHPRMVKEQSDWVYLQQPNGGGIAKIAVTPLIRPHSNESYRRAERPAVLAKRAWAFQERLLSCRILYFGTEQMYFECNVGFFCESIRFPLQTEMDGIGSLSTLRKRLTASPRRLLREWYWTVARYSECELTHRRDRLPALAGLARLVQDRLGYEYYQGLWMEDLSNGLGRMREEMLSYHTTSKDEHERVGGDFLDQADFPSWSWASCNYPIQTRNVFSWDCKPHTDFEVITSRSKASDGAAVETQGRRLTIRGRIAPAVLTHNMLRDTSDLQPPHEIDRCEYLRLDRPYRQDPLKIFTQQKRETLKTQFTKQIECLLLAEEPEVLLRGGHKTILLLEAVYDDPTSNLYRRCGAYYAGSSCQWLAKAAVREITII